MLDRLLWSGTLSAGECLDDAFSVVRAHGRNHVVLVRTRNLTLVVKRFSTGRHERRELALLRLLRARHLRHFSVPSLVLREPQTLVMASASTFVPLGTRLRYRAGWVDVAASLGSALGELHDGALPPRPFDTRVPLFNPLVVGPDVLGESPAVRRTICELQEDDAVREALADLLARLGSGEMTPIHGDVRTGNILTGRRRDAALMLIDWETGGSGCPWLDVGAGVAMLLEWSVVAGAGEPPSKSVTALLEGYRAIGDRAIDLRSVVQCAGLRMLQAGVEYGEDSVDIAAVARRFQRVGLILLTRPEEAAIRLGLVS